jgi:hypothetical protein
MSQCLATDFPNLSSCKCKERACKMCLTKWITSNNIRIQRIKCMFCATPMSHIDIRNLLQTNGTLVSKKYGGKKHLSEQKFGRPFNSHLITGEQNFGFIYLHLIVLIVIRLLKRQAVVHMLNVNVDSIYVQLAVNNITITLLVYLVFLKTLDVCYGFNIFHLCHGRIIFYFLFVIRT